MTDMRSTHAGVPPSNIMIPGSDRVLMLVNLTIPYVPSMNMFFDKLLFCFTFKKQHDG